MELLFAALVLAQDPPEPPAAHAQKDPFRCETCKKPLEKAIEYVRGRYAEEERGNDALLARFNAGLMFLILEEKGKELEACVDFFKKAIRGGTGNQNWFLGMSWYFLSEYYLRHPDPEVRKLMEGLFELAESRQEETGGWCHTKGFWKRGYNKVGGGKDMAMLTAMFYAAFWNMKAAGLEVPDPILERTDKNLQDLSDGSGFVYGTDNKSRDLSMGRGGVVLQGLLNAGQTAHPFYARIRDGLERRFAHIEEGHSCAALHHYSVPAAMHRLGMYEMFAGHWIDTLIARQKEDGSIHLIHDGGKRYKNVKNECAETACFAIILLLQSPAAFEPGSQDKRAGSGGRNPFGRKKSD